MLKILGKTDKVRDEWTVSKIIDNYEDKITVFDNAVQRGLDWNIEKKSRLIRSSILNRPMQNIFASKHGEIYSNLDGKQRSFAWVEFVHDQYELKDLDPIDIEDTETETIETIDLNGKKFSDLPPVIQKSILNLTVSVVIIDNATEDEECEIFYDLNNGKPLNAITVTRARTKSRKQIVQLGKHELFKNALTEKALEKYTNEDIVIKSWAILHQENPSLETKVIRPLMAEAEFTQEDIDQLNSCFDRILEAHSIIEDKKIKKRLLTRTHLIGIMRVVWDSIQRGLSVNQFTEWFCKFFSGTKSATIDSEYNSYAGAGSAKESSVKHRLDALQKNYEEYLKGLFITEEKAQELAANENIVNLKEDIFSNENEINTKENEFDEFEDLFTDDPLDQE